MFSVVPVFVGAVVTVKPFAFVPALLAVPLLFLSACGTTPPPEFKGRWHPVNHFGAVPQEIPLQQAYAFYASPMDGTLKHMLERWARDAHMTLAYRHPSDYTLVAPVADVHTGNLAEATSALRRIYAAQRVNVSVQGNQIVVALGDGVARGAP